MPKKHLAAAWLAVAEEATPFFVELFHAGLTYQEIADHMNNNEFSYIYGGPWTERHVSSYRATIKLKPRKKKHSKPKHKNRLKRLYDHKGKFDIRKVTDKQAKIEEPAPQVTPEAEVKMEVPEISGLAEAVQENTKVLNQILLLLQGMQKPEEPEDRPSIIELKLTTRQRIHNIIRNFIDRVVTEQYGKLLTQFSEDFDRYKVTWFTRLKGALIHSARTLLNKNVAEFGRINLNTQMKNGGYKSVMDFAENETRSFPINGSEETKKLRVIEFFYQVAYELFPGKNTSPLFYVGRDLQPATFEILMGIVPPGDSSCVNINGEETQISLQMVWAKEILPIINPGAVKDKQQPKAPPEAIKKDPYAYFKAESPSKQVNLVYSRVYDIIDSYEHKFPELTDDRQNRNHIRTYIRNLMLSQIYSKMAADIHGHADYYKETVKDLNRTQPKRDGGRHTIIEQIKKDGNVVEMMKILDNSYHWNEDSNNYVHQEGTIPDLTSIARSVKSQFKLDAA
jgi:hypothetical protein